jgi:hypothetical protein
MYCGSGYVDGDGYGAGSGAFSSNHTSNTSTKQLLMANNDKKLEMVSHFQKWGIKLEWVVLFPHIDDFNGWHSGQNFLGCVSHTIQVSNTHPSYSGIITKQRQMYTFCQ